MVKRHFVNQTCIKIGGRADAFSAQLPFFIRAIVLRMINWQAIETLNSWTKWRSNCSDRERIWQFAIYIQQFKISGSLKHLERY